MEFKSIDMKTILYIILLTISINANAQTWNEIFRQKETQEKYLIQQLAALKLYGGYLKKGYDIANKGINSIKGFTKGEFNLHEDFFNSLKQVNPLLAKNEKITDILKWQISIRKDLNSISTNGEFSTEDRNYFKEVRIKVIRDCEIDLDELLLVITSGKVEMKDDERIKRLNGLHYRMEDKYRFAQSFRDKVKTLALQRQQELRNIKFSQEIHQITN